LSPLGRSSCRYTHQRDDGQQLFAFRLSDEREEAEVESLCSAFAKALGSEASVGHVLKFHDSLQAQRHQRYAEEIYALEMRLREVISFIFIDSYGKDYYDLLREVKLGALPPDMPNTDEEFKKRLENEFFWLVFSQYPTINERKLPTSPQEVLRFLGGAADFLELKNTITSLPIRKPMYSDFLVKIKGWVMAVEKLRNCVAHNRALSDKYIQDYQQARPLLLEAIREFFQKAVTPPP
jgi:hypothetical protein